MSNEHAPAQIITAPAQIITAPAQIITAPAQFITAPDHLVTAPAQPPLTGAAVYTAWFRFREIGGQVEKMVDSACILVSKLELANTSQRCPKSPQNEGHLGAIDN